ncbi:MAG TPA: DinB family protein [Chloroflexia bacterium]|nr:DinB family protein [Chloroflexia bacterium]
MAQEEAQRFNHNYIGTEHILLGLVREGDHVAGRVLNNLGLDLQKVRFAVEFIIGRGERQVLGELGLTPRAKRVIELSVDEARRLKHNYIGTEHLLLGLIREGEGIAAGVLESLGVSLDSVRQEVIRILNDPKSITAMPQEGAIEHPGPSLDMLRTMFDYSIWARDKLLAAIEALDEGQLREAGKTGVYGSIYDTLAHLAVSEWLWTRRCMGESPLKLPKGEDFAHLGALLEWWDGNHAQAVQYLSSITDQDLSRELTYMAPDGKERTRKVWHMLLQVPNHQTEHRAQIGTMLGQLGVEVPPTDLVVYLSEQA